MKRSLMAAVVLGMAVPAGEAWAAACDPGTIYSRALTSFVSKMSQAPATPPTARSVSLDPSIAYGPLNGEGGSATVATASVAFSPNEMFSVWPTVGVCRYSDGEDSESKVLLGGGLGISPYVNAAGTLAAGVQTQVSRISGDGWSELTIPVLAVINARLAPQVAGYAGAGIRHFRVSYSGEGPSATFSETDPAVAAGVLFFSGNVTVGGGLTVHMAEGENSFGLSANISIPLNIFR